MYTDPARRHNPQAKAEVEAAVNSRQSKQNEKAFPEQRCKGANLDCLGRVHDRRVLLAHAPAALGAPVLQHLEQRKGANLS